MQYTSNNNNKLAHTHTRAHSTRAMMHHIFVCLQPSPSDNNLLLSANRPQVVNTISDNDITTSDDSRVNPYTGQGHTFQPLILVAGSRHVTVVAVAPPSCPDQAVRCTPPPAYESLFPEVANSIEENT